MSNQGYRPVYKWDEPNLKQLNDNLRAMWKKVMGRVEMRDLSPDTQSTIESKADGEVVGELQETVVKMGTAIEKTDEAIALKADKKTVETLSGQVTKNSAELKVTAEAITSTVTAVTELGDRVNKAESKIEQTPEQIRLAVSQVQIGGRNLLRNTAELKTANHLIDESGASARGKCTEDEFGGFHVVCKDQNIRCWMGDYAVTPGQSYAMSVRYKMNSGAAPIQFQYVLKSAGGADLYYWDSVNHSTTSTIAEDGWTVLRSVIIIPDNPAVAKVSLALRTGLDEWLYTCDYNIRRPKFEIGNKVTDWSPAPEDTDAAIDELSAALVVQAGEIVANATKIETVGQAAASAQNAANAAQGTANGAVTRVTSAENRISAVEGSITSKVSQNEFDILGNKVSENTSAITQTAEAIRSEVASSVSGLQTQIEQTDEQVLILAGRTVGGTNILRNTGTLRTANYAIDSSGASAMGSCTEDEFGGFRIVCNNANVRWWPGDQMISPGQSYAMSIQYKMNSGSAPIQFQYVLKSADGADLYFWDSVNHSQGGSRTEDGWTVLTSVITIPNDARIAKMALAVRTGWDGVLYTCDYNIRRPKFETGSMATDWSPHPEDPAASVNAGGVVRVDQSGVHMSGGTIEMETSDGEEYIHIKNSGIAASSLDAPNVAKRYAGAAALYVDPNATSAQLAAGNYYRSFADACAALSGGYLEKSVTITVQGATYGDAYLRGVTGYGSVTVNGGNNILYGSLSLLDNTSEIFINGLKIVRTGTGHEFAGRQYGTGWARWYQCVLDGNGGAQALLADRGARLMIWETELYNAARLLQVGHNADASCITLRGGGGTNFLLGDGGRITWSGTRPDGTLRIDNPCLKAPDDLAGISIAYGSAQPSVPTIQTASWNYLYTDSYAGKWGRPSGDAAQGVIQTDNSGETAAIYGAIWFDAAAIRSALGGKTINQASLRLHALVGYGRGVEVSVQLYGTNQAYDGRSGQPELTTSYGTIASIKPGNTAEITIPVAAIADIVSGRIQALVLKSDDTALREGKTYSTNYARFAGSTSATAENCPRLTVVYQ